MVLYRRVVPTGRPQRVRKLTVSASDATHEQASATFVCWPESSIRGGGYLLATLVLCVAELFSLSRSCVVEVTIAVLLSTVPDSAVTVTTTVMVAVAPFARLPRFTVTVPLLPTAGAVTAP